jgi:hypothetical protein
LSKLSIPAYLIRQGQKFNTIVRTAPLQENKVYRVLGTGRVITQTAPDVVLGSGSLPAV